MTKTNALEITRKTFQAVNFFSFILLTVASTAVAGDGKNSDAPPPFTVDAKLFGDDGQKHAFQNLEKAPGAETITIFAPREDTDKFSNGVQVYPFKGYLYAQWQSTPKHEDTKDSRVVWSRSPNGVDWEPPRELAAQPENGGFMRSGAGFFSDGKTLVAYIQRVDSWYPGKVKMTEARTTTDGETWSPIQAVTDCGAMAENVRALPSGRLFTAVQGHLPNSGKMYGLAAYSDQADGLGNWKIADMPQPKSKHDRYGRGIEPSWYLRADKRPVIVYRDMNRTGRLLAALGTTDGERFAEPELTDYPDSNSMQCAGNLPDGTAYLVNNPHPSSRRILGISLSRDGKHFDSVYKIRSSDDLQPRRFDGGSKDSGYSYPGAVVWGDHLYISYATNKEDVEITRIPLKSLTSDQAPPSANDSTTLGTPPPPGAIVSHSPHASGRFLGSPSIVVLGHGDYLVSHDRYGPRMADSSTHVYRSRDAGQSWQRLADIEDIGLHWASLFQRQKNVYLMGADGAGNTVILRSSDQGRTWTRPKDENSGMLLEGSYHPLSTSWLVHNGRIWKPNEYAKPGVRWGPRFEAFMMSAPAEANLLRRDSWRLSNRLGYQADWLNGRFGGWLEGNAVVTPMGQPVNILRVHFGYDRFTQAWRDYDGDGRAAIVRISDDGRTATFDPDNDFIEFPGGLVRFQIRYDEVSDYYWALTSYVPPAHRQAKRISDRIRNTVALVRSKDLRNWEIRSIVLYHPNPHTRGFQNVAWEFDGDDIVAISRTSWPDTTSASTKFRIDQAHDSNYITFHRIPDFRNVSWKESVIAPAAIGMDRRPNE